MRSEDDGPGSFSESSLRWIYDEYKRIGSIRGFVREHSVTYHYARTKIMMAQRIFESDGFEEEAPSGLKSSVSSDVSDEIDGGVRVVTGRGIRTLDDLVKQANVSEEDWIVTKHLINKWDAVGKDGVVELFQVKAWLEKRPEFFAPVIKPVQVKKRRLNRKESPEAVALIIPDSQHGFRRLNGKLVPIHDRRCIDLAIQVCDYLKPDEVVLLGDMLDLAPWGKYSTSPDLKYTTQPSLLELHWFLQSLRDCGDHTITYLEGNHEARIKRAVVDKLEEAVELRPVGRDVARPIFSIPNLLSLDEISVDYVEPYGKAYWLFDNLVRCHHGNTVRPKGGQTVTAMLSSGTTSSEIVGHIHRREFASRRIPSGGGFVTVDAMSPGCFCRVDTEISMVPAYAGKPVDWQQGIGIVYKYKDRVQMQLIPIDDGVCYVNGERFVGSDLEKEMLDLLSS